jgi:hypothetical protein
MIGADRHGPNAGPANPARRCPLFRILYLFVIAEPPSWVAYVHSATIIGLMGLVYYQSTKRRMGFMPMFAAMAGIFMVDFLVYIPYAGYLLWRDRRRARSVDPDPRSVDPDHRPVD